MKDYEPTKGCLRAAQIIMNGKKKMRTNFGEKTLLGVADIIYRETVMPDLLEACKGLLNLETRYTNVGRKEFDAARRAIAKVEGREP